MEIFLLILFGALAGVVGGMGMGGGTLLIPLLTIFLSVNQIMAQGFNLLCFLPMSIVAIIIHIKNKMIEKDGLFLIIIFGVAFSCLGAYLASLIDSEILGKLFGVFLINLSIWEFTKILRQSD